MMLGLMNSFIKNPVKAAFYGEDTDENILYILRSSPIITIPWILASLAFAVVPFFVSPILYGASMNGEKFFSIPFVFALTLFWYLFTFGFFFQNYLNWYYNVYIITNKRIVDIDFHGVMYKNISETTLSNVEDVTSNVKGTLGIIFNIGDVYIQTAAERPQFEFTSVDQPSKIRDIISDLVAGVRKNATTDLNN